MATITDKGMQARPIDKEQWLTQPFKRGAGVFVGRITPSGERVFYFRYTDSKGRRPFLPIGPYHPKGKDGFTLAQAYARACELSALYLSGVKDLREHLEQEAERLQLQQEAELRRIEAERLAAELLEQQRLTLRSLFTRWKETELLHRVAPDGADMGRKDSGAFAQAQFDRHIGPRIGHLGAADVRKADVLGVIDALMSAGKQRTAQLVFSDLRQMFAFGLDRELIAADPMATLRKARVVGAATERERALSVDELRMLASGIGSARLSERSVCALWLILATGIRVGELMGATWAQDLPAGPLQRQARVNELLELGTQHDVKAGFVDLAARTWHIPDTKNGRSHTVHLSPFALAQLECLAGLREVLRGGDGQALTPWVFPASDNHHPVCVKSFGKQIADRQRTTVQRMSGRTKAVASLALPGGRWTAHDLRRTAASLMAARGVSGDVIDECLNHVIESRVRRTYIRDRRTADQARAFDILGQCLQEIRGEAPQAAAVLPFPARQA